MARTHPRTSEEGERILVSSSTSHDRTGSERALPSLVYFESLMWPHATMCVLGHRGSRVPWQVRRRPRPLLLRPVGLQSVDGNNCVGIGPKSNRIGQAHSDASLANHKPLLSVRLRPSFPHVLGTRSRNCIARGGVLDQGAIRETQGESGDGSRFTITPSSLVSCHSTLTSGTAEKEKGTPIDGFPLVL